MPSRLAISDRESFPWRSKRLISGLFLPADSGLPKIVPWAQTSVMPAFIRSCNLSCSNVANTASIPPRTRPWVLAMSKALVSGTNPILSSAASFGVATSSGSERPIFRGSGEVGVQPAAAHRGKTFLPLCQLQSARADLLNLGSNLPTGANSILPHRLELRREPSPGMTGDESVEGDRKLAGAAFFPSPIKLLGSEF